MSSIAAGVNAERTNRWLLIGALVLAVLAGILVFALLANFGGDDDEGAAGGGVPSGENRTLVAKQDIEAGTTLSGDMFELREYDDATIVNDPVSSLEAVEGHVVRTDVFKGNQLSLTSIQEGTGATELEEQLPFLFAKGLRAIGVATDDIKIVGGHVRPGDYVDVAYVWEEEIPGDDDHVIRHTEYLFQNIEVLARTTEPVDGVVVLRDTGTPDEVTGEEDQLIRRNDEVDPGDDAHAIVVGLAPDQILRLMSSLNLGEITFVLRSYGDNEIRDVPPIVERVTND